MRTLLYLCHVIIYMKRWWKGSRRQMWWCFGSSRSRWCFVWVDMDMMGRLCITGMHRLIGCNLCTITRILSVFLPSTTTCVLQNYAFTTIVKHNTYKYNCLHTFCIGFCNTSSLFCISFHLSQKINTQIKETGFMRFVLLICKYNRRINIKINQTNRTWYCITFCISCSICVTSLRTRSNWDHWRSNRSRLALVRILACSKSSASALESRGE